MPQTEGSSAADLLSAALQREGITPDNNEIHIMATHYSGLVTQIDEMRKLLEAPPEQRRCGRT